MLLNNDSAYYVFIVLFTYRRYKMKFLSDSWFKIKGNEYLKRAMEVSLTGDFNITVIGKRENGYFPLLELLGNKLTFIVPCKCNELNILEYCACDILDKIKYQRKNELKESLNNPIIVKLESPVLSDFNSINKDTYEDVMNHINRVKKFIATNEINKDMLKMDRSAYDLLDTAINRLHLTVNSIENIKNVAVIIAVMDHFSFGIKAQHVSEAVSFQCYRFMNDVI